jgi:hypothetical protein
MNKDLNTNMTLCKKCGVWYQELGPNWIHNCSGNMLMKVEQPKILQQESQIRVKFEIMSKVDEEPMKLPETDKKYYWDELEES